MARRCKVCKHPERAAIEAAVPKGVRLGDETLAEVAYRYELSRVALQRHMRHHLGDETQEPLSGAPEEVPKVAPPASGSGEVPSVAPPAHSTGEVPTVAPSPTPDCKVCSHDKRALIEQAIVAGDSHVAIGRQFFIEAGVVRRHIRQCLAKETKRAFKRSRAPDKSRQSFSAQERSEYLWLRVKSLIERLEGDGDVLPNGREMASLVTASTRLLELLAKLNGELGREADLFKSAQWQRIQAAIATALAPYPDAAAAVAAALAEAT